MTKRLVRLHVTEVRSCMFCPSRSPKTYNPTHCERKATAEGAGRPLPPSMKSNAVPRWCPLPVKR